MLLQKNLNRFMQPDNGHIKKEYNKLRRLIMQVLRAIEAVRTSENRGDAEVVESKPHWHWLENVVTYWGRENK